MPDDKVPPPPRRTWQFGLATAILWMFIGCCLSLAGRRSARAAVVLALLCVVAGSMTLIGSPSLRERRTWFDASLAVALVSGTYAVYHVWITVLRAE